jgi:hypothetical protein
MIGRCFCKSEYQDKKYGQGLRVMNRMENGKMRCTVCGKETDAPAAKGQAKETKR